MEFGYRLEKNCIWLAYVDHESFVPIIYHTFSIPALLHSFIHLICSDTVIFSTFIHLHVVVLLRAAELMLTCYNFLSSKVQKCPTVCPSVLHYQFCNSLKMNRSVSQLPHFFVIKDPLLRSAFPCACKIDHTAGHFLLSQDPLQSETGYQIGKYQFFFPFSSYFSF